MPITTFRISIRARCTTLCDKACQWLATGQWFSTGPPVSSTNKTVHHDITEILLKVALNTIKQTNKPFKHYRQDWNTANNLCDLMFLAVTWFSKKKKGSSEYCSCVQYSLFLLTRNLNCWYMYIYICVLQLKRIKEGFHIMHMCIQYTTNYGNCFSLFTPWYSWNIAIVGVKHQPIKGCSYFDKSKEKIHLFLQTLLKK